MPPIKTSLPKSIVDFIHASVEKLYDRAIKRFTGRQVGDKRIVISTRVTLPDLYTAGAHSEGAKPTESVQDALIRTARGYIEAEAARNKVRVVNAVESWLNNARRTGVKTDAETVLGGQLADLWGKATSDIKRIVETESTTARNAGTLDGIAKIATYLGVDDPVVYFQVVKDLLLCEECKKLHLMPDEVTPRLWKLSQISHGYHKKGEDSPSLSGAHPSCRCSLLYLSPGYSFNSSGSIEFHSLNYDAYAEQQGVNKAEAPSPLPAIHSAPLDDDGLPYVGSAKELVSFTKTKPKGVFVSFDGSKTGVGQDMLYSMVRKAVNECAPSGRIFLKKEEFKMHLPSKEEAEEVMSRIRTNLLSGEE